MSKSHSSSKPSPSHPHKPSKPVKKANLYSPLDSTTWRNVKTSFIPKLLKLQDSVKRSTALSEFVKIDSKDSKDQKTTWSDMSEELNDLTQQLSLLRTAARAAIGRDKAMTVIYSAQNVVNGAASTAVTLSIPLSPTTSAEWSSYAALYDECIVTKMIVHYTWFTDVTTAGVHQYAVGFDSTRNSAAAGQADVMESTQHQIGAYVVTTGAIQRALEPISHDGYRKFDIKQHHNPVANAAAVTGGNGIIANFPGEWFETNNALTLAYSVGYLRVYNSSLASNTARFHYNVAYHCMFRERT